MSHRSCRIAISAIAATGLLGAAGAVGAAPASAKSGDVVARGACSGLSDWKLKLGPRGNVIETEFEVDSNRAGQTWKVRITQNGATVVNTTATTAGASGSFTVRARLANKAGTDKFVATASNAATGEKCTGRASV